MKTIGNITYKQLLLLLFLVVVIIVLNVVRMGVLLIPYLPQPEVQAMAVERKGKGREENGRRGKNVSGTE